MNHMYNETIYKHLKNILYKILKYRSNKYEIRNWDYQFPQQSSSIKISCTNWRIHQTRNWYLFVSLLLRYTIVIQNLFDDIRLFSGRLESLSRYFLHNLIVLQISSSTFFRKEAIVISCYDFLFLHSLC